MTLDPELELFEQFVLPDLSDVAAVRTWAHAFAANAPPPDPGVMRDLIIVEQIIPGTADAPPIPIRIYRPRSAKRVPTLLYFHGGSFIMGDLDTEHLTCVRYARESGAGVIAVQYRLAPENPFPAGVEDCYAALVWISKNAAKLEMDENRIAVGGCSAGGNLASAVAIMARDRGGPRPVLQLLVYPALDDRMATASVNSSARQFVITRATLGYMWRHYLGGAGMAASAYAAPTRLTDCSNLPSAYIEACELDPLRDETIEFASRLLRSGISVDFHVVPGAPHGFDMVSSAAVTRQAFANRSAALRKAFGTRGEGMNLSTGE
jgi:acetyl esterase/lipase